MFRLSPVSMERFPHIQAGFANKGRPLLAEPGSCATYAECLLTEKAAVEC